MQTLWCPEYKDVPFQACMLLNRVPKQALNRKVSTFQGYSISIKVNWVPVKYRGVQINFRVVLIEEFHYNIII